MKKILCAFGTRPEVIKMAPVISLLEKEAHLSLRTMATAQHRKILDQMLSVFHIVPDLDLNVMQEDQSLAALTSNLTLAIDKVLHGENPDLVLAQGDTTTTFMIALLCHYHRIPFGHIEAGLRTHCRYYPFPEEMNRSLISRLSTLHFAPTRQAKHHLLREGIDDSFIFVTGNTVIDALEMILLSHAEPMHLPLQKNKRLILVTAHRRENIGEKLKQICHAVQMIAKQYSDVQIIFPVHPNPQVSKIIHQELDGNPSIALIPPLKYNDFVFLMKKAYLILTDSGGVQEEAPYLGTPVLVLRNETERPEAVELGASQLVGSDPHRIVRAASHLLNDPIAYQEMISPISPYGDGKAAQRIVHIVKSFVTTGVPSLHDEEMLR